MPPIKFDSVQIYATLSILIWHEFYNPYEI